MDVAPWNAAWRLQAACLDKVNVFFPGRGRKTVRARAICAICPVIADCLAYVDAHKPSQILGYWAGMTAKERKVRYERIRQM